jgi:ParB family chromosome partitioning protein
MNIPLDHIVPNPDQPRKSFDKTELDNLAQSIRQYGILQPILIEEAAEGMYILHDGERRTRAARLAGLIDIPAQILPSKNGKGSQERLIHALIANLQRCDLNPIEEAHAFNQLKIKDNLTVRQLSIQTGISEMRIGNSLLLLKLDKPIQDLIERGQFTHLSNLINLILDIPDGTARVDLCKKLAARGVGKNIKAVQNSASLLIKKLNSEMPFPADKIPGLELAKTKADLPKWDILYQAGKVPSWGVIYKSAIEVCNNCPRRPAASESTCAKCQAAELISKIIELGNREKAHNLAKSVISRRAKIHERR